MQKIITERLILREWLESDLEPFIALNQDEKVMEFFPSILSKTETEDFVTRIKKHFADHGFGLYACQLKSTKEFIGFAGFSTPSFEAHFTPCVEIGWRIAEKFWNQGYATEAAKAVLEFGFKNLNLKEIVSFTSEKNLRSISVMKKIGMTQDMSDDFLHPKLEASHPLARHVLFRIINRRES